MRIFWTSGKRCLTFCRLMTIRWTSQSERDCLGGKVSIHQTSVQSFPRSFSEKKMNFQSVLETMWLVEHRRWVSLTSGPSSWLLRCTEEVNKAWPSGCPLEPPFPYSPEWSGLLYPNQIPVTQPTHSPVPDAPTSQT